MYGVRKWERGPGEGREQYRGDGGLILQGLKGLTKDFHLYFKRDDGKVLIWEIIRPYLIANGIRMSSKETSLNINTYIHNVANISKIHVENRRWLKAMAPHSGTLAWKIPWTEGPGGLQSMGSLGVRHDWATSLSLLTFMHWRRKWQPTPVFLPGESQGRGSLVGCRLWGRTESDTTEAT